MIPPRNTNYKYGTTPYVRMGSQKKHNLPYFMPSGTKPFDQVIVVNKQAWPIKFLKPNSTITKDNIMLSRTPGQNSIYDTRWIPFGRDVGNVTAMQKKDGAWRLAKYDIVFAFTFSAFQKQGIWKLK